MNMDVRKCACGCGKALVNPSNNQKYYNQSHKRRFYYLRNKNITITSAKKKTSRTPEQRWRNMSWEALTAELLKLHKSYGEVQSMYYNGTLPDDFGKKQK